MEKFKKYIWYVVGFLLLLGIAATCTTQYVSKKEGEKVQLEKQLDSLKLQFKESEKSRLAQKDSLQKDNEKKDSIISKLHKDNSILEVKIIAVKEKANKEKEKVKNYDFKQLAEWLGDRYNLPESVTSTENSVNLLGAMPVKVAEDLITKDELASTVKLQEEKLQNKDVEIQQKDEKLLNKDLEIASSEVSINLMKETQKTSDDLNKTNNNIIKGLKTKALIGGASGVVLGIVAGILISK